MDGFMEAVQAGFFETVNPFNGKTRTLACSPDQVAAIVFWSKNFEPFLNGSFGETLLVKGYRLLFNFTVNSADALLEPHLPPLKDRLSQLRQLCRRFGPACVQWRFDPVCHYRHGNGPIQNNRADFEAIALAASACGVTRCITSFADPYAKAQKRFAAAGLAMVEPALEDKIRLIAKMAGLLADHGIGLFLCCEPEVLAGLGPGAGVKQSCCISHDLIMGIYGGALSERPDRGQRRSRGCGCHQSVDIGDYARHPCRHRCLYCYANPSANPLPPAGNRR
jgi:hypothetical protein